MGLDQQEGVGGLAPTALESLMDRLRRQSSRPVGPRPSPSDEQLLELLESHANHETEALQAYDELAARSPDEYVRYLAGILLEDERRHHQLVAEMVNRVRADAEWRPIEPNVPHTGSPHDRAGLLEATERLLETERDDLRQIGVLKRRLRRQRYQSLLSLVADLLEFDTRKHIHILAFLHSTART